MFARTRPHACTVLIVVGVAVVATLIPVGDVLAQTQESATHQGPNRGGFTLLLTMGFALQSNEFVDESAVGLGGMNLGIGGFVSPNMAVMFRISGSSVTFDDIGISEKQVESVSGVGGPCVQYWVNDFVNLEGGAGLGFADADPIPGEEQKGFGLILGAGFSFFHRGSNSLQVGIEYAPVFTRNRNVQNVSINFGWQLL